ncbi:hypothetical protein [Clostridium sp.]|uniref:hypothetical protein n=1 Tax=Clostridium sp. TaxID=1506 RepID=UPI001D34EB2B|nr:hypothetical protein [Clostridium sp.]MBS5985259.1 hypothetical protein [Clostridium sp.]
MLKNGQVFKNYKGLCEFIGWKVATGNTKIAQFKELDTICKWHKEGNKIIIDEVYENQLIKKDGRSDNNVYSSLVEALIIHSINNSEDHTLYFSLGNISETVGMVNENFKELKVSSVEMSVDYLLARSFKRSTKAEAKRIIDRCLKSMKSKRIIDYDFGKIIVGEDNTLRKPTIEEKKIILDIEESVMTSLGCSNFLQIENRNLIPVFNSKVAELIKDKGIENFKSSFSGYEIVSSDRLIKKAIDEFEKSEKMKSLNDLFFNKMKLTFLSKHNSAVKKIEDNLEFGEGIYLGEAEPNFLSNIDMLMERYIKIVL